MFEQVPEKMVLLIILAVGIVIATARVAIFITHEKHRCTIFCQRNYGYAGAIHFYGHSYNLPEPVTFHESYVFWAPDTIAGEPIIYIFYNSDEMQQLFNNIEETGSVNNPWFREKGLKVFVCRNPKTDIQKVYIESIHNERSHFQRN